jgi:hypothetical protein
MGIYLLELRTKKRWSFSMFVNMCDGMIRYDMCTLYSCFWLKQPKIRKKRRSVGKLHSDVDLIKTLSFCYDLDELKLRNAIGFDVCDSCFNNLRSIFVSLNKCNQLKAKLSTRVSPSYRLLCDKEVQLRTLKKKKLADWSRNSESTWRIFNMRRVQALDSR